MLNESAPYKKYLLRQAKKIRRWHEQNAWTDSRLEEFERDIFHAFFTIRKLGESRKLSDAVVARLIPVQKCRPTGKKVTLISRHEVRELYDLNHPAKTTRTIAFLCNQLIHSYVFSLFVDAGRGTSSFYFSSDREKRLGLYRMTRGTFCNLLLMVGSNCPSTIHLTYDASKTDFSTAIR